MQYIGENQKDSDCVIVATHNAAKWQGRVLSYAKLEKVALKHYGYSPENGFPTRYVGVFLDEFAINHRTVPRATIGQVEDRILSGNGMMVNYYRPGGSKGHMVLVVPEKDRTIKIVNSNLTWIELVQQVVRGELKMQIWNLGKGPAK